MGESAKITRSRRLPFWAMPVALSFCALAGVFVLLWLKLPAWAPAWVVEHSPWVDPVMRSVIADRDLGSPARDRIVSWGPNQVSRVLPWLEHDSPRIRSLAAECLGEMKSEQALPGLLRAAADPDRDVVHEAVDALGKLGDERAIPSLVGALQRSDLAWGYILSSLSKMPDKAVADAIFPLPDAHTDEDARFLVLACALNDVRAVTALQEVMRTPPAEPLADGIIASLATRQEMAASGLALSPHPAGVPALIDAFSDPGEQIRLHAVAGVMMTYGRKLDPRLLQMQILALDDPYPKVRMLAALSFRFLQADLVEPKLVKLSSEMDPMMRRYALQGLGSKWASDVAIARLVEAMHDPDEKVAVSAVSALASTKNITVLSSLIAELAGAKGKVRTRILEALADEPFANDSRAFSPLLELLEHPRQYQHERARAALWRLKLSDEQQQQVDEVTTRRQTSTASP